MKPEGINRSLPPVQTGSVKNRVNRYRDTGINFADLIKEKVQPEELKFSSHAENRIKSRGIKMDEEVRQKLNKAASRVAAKGGRDALLFMKDSAFIVNVKNRTVVTAMDSDSMKENVFTNIDSAALAE
ncbi:MAG: TIGR02530 family flagellar biosynthesis protein [Fibrobacterota bacterium]